MLPRLARELRENLDSTSSQTYARYFFGRDEQNDVPPRSGYYVGYLVAQRIGNGKSLQALATMRGPPLRAAIEQALREIEEQR
jgi:uncharacterized protein YjaZ